MKTIPVFFSTNYDITSWLAIAFVSMAENTEHNIDLYILDCGITDADRKIINDICDKYKNLGTPKFFAINPDVDFAGCGKWTAGLAAWGRFVFPELAPHLDRAVYMDNDVMVLGDIAKLYEMDLNGHVIAAAPELYLGVPHNAERLKQHQEIIRASSNHIPFCNGVMVMDLKKWRDGNFTEKVKSIGRENCDRFYCPDQDSMNMMFADNYQVIDNTLVATNWDVACLKFDYPDRFRSLNENIIVRHFNITKPWREYYMEREPMMHRELFWYYAQKTPFADYFMMEFINSSKEKTVNDIRSFFPAG